MKKNNSFIKFLIAVLLVAVILIAIPGGDADAQDVSCPYPQRTHIVSSGETLFGIATQYGVTMAEISGLSGISNQDYIQVGQRLCIPGVANMSDAQPTVIAPTPTTIPIPDFAVAGTGVGELDARDTVETFFEAVSFDDDEANLKNPEALNPGSRGKFEFAHWFIVLGFGAFFLMRIRQLAKGSKRDLVRIVAMIAISTALVFLQLEPLAGILLAIILYALAYVLGFVGENDHTSFGMTILFTAILASMFGKLGLLGINSSDFFPLDVVNAKWENLAFDEVWLSVGIYAHLIVAGAVMLLETVGELRITLRQWQEATSKVPGSGRELWDMIWPQNTGQLVMDALLAVFIALVWLIFAVL